MLSNLCITLKIIVIQMENYKKTYICSSSSFKFDIRRKLYTNWFHRAYASEQGAEPNTVNRTIKLRLLARPTVPVSTAISQNNMEMN